jgi:DNA primase
VIVQSTPAAGKSQLMDAVLSFMPGEALVRFSAMTGQSLYYLGERDLAHKVLAVAEEEGAERAAYALKLLQSEGEISIASTGKDTASGRLVTHEYRVTGPTAIMLTTTAIDVDEELLNRCLVLSVDEDRAQTRAIHVRQRRAHTLDGIIENRRRDEVLDVWRNAQRLLEPVIVVNPFADRLGFTDGRTRTRRDHVKYLTLIQAITLLHQHQRPRKTATVDGHTVTYIEATVDDIALANRLAHEVLGRSLDELPPQTRRLVDALSAMVAGICEHREIARDTVRFTRREAREHTGWSDFQLRTHLGRLVELEFVAVHRGGRGQSFVYELTWDGHGDGAPHLPGLVDIDNLGEIHAYDSNCEGPAAGFEGGSSPQRAGVVHGPSTPENGTRPGPTRANGAKGPKTTTGPGKRPVEVIAAPPADETADQGGPVEGVA